MSIADEVWVQRRHDTKSRDPDTRTSFQVDYGRIVHSEAFRRLQGKTQILGLGESDFYRTRLTHSIEVAQIGEGIVSHLDRVLGQRNDPRRCWLPVPELIRAICLIHDLGHPPFGHGGEVALNRKMLHDGGFEGNGQSLRIVARLEQYYPGYGMNLTRRTLLGLLKYPVAHREVVGSYPQDETAMSAFKPPKCYLDGEIEVVDWLLAPLANSDRELFCQIRPARSGKVPDHRSARYKALDTSIMDVADDISYGIHDMEDGIALGFISRDDLVPVLEQLRQDLHKDHWLQRPMIEAEIFKSAHLRKKWVSIFVGKLIRGVELISREEFGEPLLRYNAALNEELATILEAFKTLVFRKVIRNTNVCMADYKGQQIIQKLYGALHDEKEHLLPETYRQPQETTPLSRRICDYVACMTDEFAGKLYQKLFHPNFGSIFDQV